MRANNRDTPRSSNGQDAGPSSRRRRVQIPHEVLSGNSKNQIPNHPNDRGVRWDLVLEIWNFVNRRVCGCGHRGGLKNRRSWFDSNILHWKTRNPKLEIRNRELCLVRLAGSGRWPLKPETPGSKPARDTLRKSQEPRTKNQEPNPKQLASWFGSWDLVLGDSALWVVVLTAACKAVVSKEVRWRREVQFLHNPFVAHAARVRVPFGSPTHRTG